MYTDPIADLLTRIRNAARARKDTLTAPYSKIKENMLAVMKEKKMIIDYKVTKENEHKVLSVELDENRRKIELKRVSKPGQRIYVKSVDIKKVNGGLGISLISTPKGILTGDEAKKRNLGGELICEII